MPLPFRPVPIRLAPMLLLLGIAACQRSPDVEDANAGDANRPPAAATPQATATPPAAPVADAAAAPGTSYACTDGTALTVAFGDHDASLQWPDGRALTLPRAESASKGGGDAYVGDDVALQRDGAGLELHDGDRAATTCTPAASGADVAAAARYACEGDTTLVRKDDGSYRAEIPGNAPIRLTRIAGSTPPVYTGASLYLRIGDGDAILSQGDRTNELHCTAG